MVAAFALANCRALGGRATHARLERMRQSPQWHGSHFENPQPLVNDTWAALLNLFKPDPNVVPRSPPSTVPVEPDRFATPPPSGLRVTWRTTRHGRIGTSAPSKPWRLTGACAAR
jgi:hypothetical protein